jgi:UPF0755 protein
MAADRENPSKPLRATISFLTLISLSATGFVISLFVFYIIFSPASPDGLTKIVDIPPGSTTRHISSILYEEGLISNPTFFEALVTVTMNSKRLQAGEYELSARMNMWTVLTILASGRSLKHRFTVPEGFTVSQVASLLEESGLADRESFLRLATDGAFLESIGLRESSAEGYLFPDTYIITRNMGEENIIKMMYRRFDEALAPELREEIERSGLKLHEILTLASIIEKETGYPPERELISAVFRNRLKKKMRLESDPTILYAIGDIDKNRILTKDKLYDSPYNTYLYRGLPPGPISNPGLDSILAAIRPAPVDYLYFVSRNNGTHYFSSDYRDHYRAVTRYQKLGLVDN